MNSRNDHLLRALAGLAAMVLLTGCSPEQAMNRREIVTAVAIEHRTEGCGVWVETLRQVGAEEEPLYQSYRGEGESFARALTAIELETGKTLYLDNCRILLLEGAQSKDWLRSILGEVDAHGGIRPLVLVALLEDGEALPQEGVPEKDSLGKALWALLDAGACSRVSLKDSLNLLDTPGRGLLLPVVRDGTEEKLCGYGAVGPEKISRVPLSLVQGVPFAQPGRQPELMREAGQGVDWVLEKKKLKVLPEIRDDRPYFVMKVLAEGVLLPRERGKGGNIPIPEAQEEVCRQIMEEYGAVMEQVVRPLGTDLFSFGKQLELHAPKAWADSCDSWEQALQTTGWELQVQVRLRQKES